MEEEVWGNLSLHFLSARFPLSVADKLNQFIIEYLRKEVLQKSKYQPTDKEIELILVEPFSIVSILFFLIFYNVGNTEIVNLIPYHSISR